MSVVLENTGNLLTRQLARSNPSSIMPRMERNAIAVISTAMISALFVIAAVAQQTLPEPQQTPTEAQLPRHRSRLQRPDGSKPWSLT